AAGLLALSQPAVSHALARLRAHFGDPLYLRSRAGLTATPLARRLAPAAIAQLHALESTLARSANFDPAVDAVHWRLSMSDLGEILFLPPLAAALRRAAPHARLDNRGIPAAELDAALEAHDIDLAVGILAPRHRGIAAETLFHERYVAITAARRGAGARLGGGARGHRLSPRQLAGAALAVASPTATYHETVPRMLEELGLVERTCVHARHYAALPELVTTTDLLAIVPQSYARSLRARWPIQVHALPGAGLEYDVRMLWHESASDDRAHAWLRALLRRLFARAPARPRQPLPQA
ncbi:MAG: LysR family transcriptional regulator, partial [Gammaproteobacteria bacterium]|nr:LysR family transcriptional regulator [Gammaproteobacteria bacterium]